MLRMRITAVGAAAIATVAILLWVFPSVKSVTSKQLSAATLPVYKDRNAPLESRVSDLFSRMTQNETIGMLSGTGFATRPIPRLGVPQLGMVDAGQGVRGGTQGTMGPATLFPWEADMAATWDRDLLRRIGHA